MGAHRVAWALPKPFLPLYMSALRLFADVDDDWSSLLLLAINGLELTTSNARIVAEFSFFKYVLSLRLTVPLTL